MYSLLIGSIRVGLWALWPRPLQWLAALQCVEACSRFHYISSVTVTPSCWSLLWWWRWWCCWWWWCCNGAVSLQVQRSLLPSLPVRPVLCQSWSDWTHGGHSPWHVQAAWALHALMTARGIACRTAWFGDWHASLWTENLPHELPEDWEPVMAGIRVRGRVQVRWMRLKRRVETGDVVL